MSPIASSPQTSWGHMAIPVAQTLYYISIYLGLRWSTNYWYKSVRFSWYQTRFPSAHRIYERLRDFQEFHLGMLSVAVLGFGMVDLWLSVIIVNKLMHRSSQNTEAEIWSAGSVGTVAIKLWNLETVTIWHCSGLIKLVSSWTIWYCFFELIVPWPGDRKETDKKKLWDIQSKSFYCLS